MNPTADVRACVPLSLYAPTSQQDPALLAEGRDGDRNEPWLEARGSHVEDQLAAAATPGCLWLAPMMAIAKKAAAPLAFQTLGGFGVQRGGQDVPAAEWKSKKARDVVKLLVAAHGRPLTREQLAEALWPGDPPPLTGNRLSVALSTLRAVLDPDRRFEPDHFLAAEKGTVRLRLENVVVDVEAFLADAEAALHAWREERSEDARTSLEDAERAYSGDFLPEERHEAWAEPLRDEARGVHVELARTLAAASEGSEAARYQLRILETDPYDEKAHIGLVKALAQAGEYDEARRAYATYTARMSEIGLEPVAFDTLGTTSTWGD